MTYPDPSAECTSPLPRVFPVFGRRGFHFVVKTGWSPIFQCFISSRHAVCMYHSSRANELANYKQKHANTALSRGARHEGIE